MPGQGVVKKNPPDCEEGARSGQCVLIDSAKECAAITIKSDIEVIPASLLCPPLDIKKAENVVVIPIAIYPSVWPRRQN